MFFQSIQHHGCLQKLELAIRLRRGLSVVIGEIGTGKSTLSRQAIRFSTPNDGQILPRIILDPEFTTPLEFLTTVTKAFGISPGPHSSEWQLKDSIKNYLFEQAVENKKIPVLIIDEGQKLPDFCIEILREFLNYETNQHKLLQIVIFAQEEFQATLKAKPNFVDRITNYHRLVPLNFQDTRSMIRHRLAQATGESSRPRKLFTAPAMTAIYLLTGGSPRKIVMLCSKIVIALIIKSRKRCGLLQVLKSARELSLSLPAKSVRLLCSSALLLLLPLIAAGLLIAQQPADSWQPRLAALNSAISAFSSKYAAKLSGPAPAELPAARQQQSPSAPSAELTAPLGPEAAPEPSPLSPPAEIPFVQAPLPALPAEQPGSPQPEIAGDLQFDPEVPLSQMIARVYGEFTNQRLHHLLLANPEIRDPEHITPGSLIHFPAHLFEPPAAELIAAASTQRVTVTSLSAAYQLIAAAADNEQAAIIPEIDAGGELAFTVVTEPGASRPAAQTAPLQQKAAERPAPKPLPEIIGSVLFDTSTTLSKMIARIYGRYTVSRQQRLMANNPHIINPDQVQPETFIYFPKQLEDTFSPGPDHSWVELATKDYLNDAYLYLKEVTATTELPIRIVPAWKDDERLLFKVVLKRLFLSSLEAEQIIATLPPPLRQAAIIRKGVLPDPNEQPQLPPPTSR